MPTNNQKKAVALKYKPQENDAPEIIAKGRGNVAENIIKTAKEHGIFLKEDKNLVEILSTLDMYKEIPQNLYKAVAEVLAFVYSVTKKFKC